MRKEIRYDAVILLKEESRMLLGRRVLYRLYRLRIDGSCSYAISVTMGEEREVCLFGSDRAHARLSFRAIADGCVTPCTLACIAADFRAERLTGERMRRTGI